MTLVPFTEVIEEDGIYTFSPPPGKSGFSHIYLNINTDHSTSPESSNIGEANIIIDENGTHQFSAREFTNSAGPLTSINRINLTTAVPQNVNVEPQRTVLASANGTYEVNPAQGYDALASVKLELNVPQQGTSNLTTDSHTFIRNTLVPYEFTPPTGYDGFSKVTVNINVPINDLTSVEHSFLGDVTGFEILPPQGFDGLSKVTVNVDTHSRYSVNYNSLLNSLPITISPDKSSFYVTNISDTLQSIPYSTEYTETTFGDVDIESETTKTVANLVPFKILNQYNGPIYRNNGNYQIAFDNAPLQPDSGVDYFENKDLGCPINIFRFRVNIPNGTETLNVTQNGTYTPTSPNIGFNSVTVNVPTSSKINLKYLSLVSGGQSSEGLGKKGFNFANWNHWTDSTRNYNATVAAGHTLVVYSNANQKHTFWVRGNVASTSISFTIRYDEYYTDLIYDIGNQVFLIDENNNNVLEYYTHSAGTTVTYDQATIVLNKNNFTLLE